VIVPPAIEELGLAWKDGASLDAASVTRAQLPAWGHTVALPMAAAGARRVSADGAPDAAWIAVTDGPSAVTGADGSAALEGVAAGTHGVVAWLPPAAGQPARVARGEVTVAPGDKVEVTLRMGS
jgi:hypothetical protein